MFLPPQTRSLHQPKSIITSTAIMIIIPKITLTITKTTITVKTRKMTTATKKIKKAIIARMKRQFPTKSYKRNCRKFERKNIQIF